MWHRQVTTIFLLAIAIGGHLGAVQALDCFTCTSEENSSCGTLHTNQTTTELPAVTCESGVNACFTRVSREGYIERGCASPTVQPCADAGCTTCTGDKCNGQRYPENGLRCLQCAGAECNAAGQIAHPCPLYAEQDSCYTAFSKDGQTIFRGCATADSKSNTVGGQLCDKLGSLCVKCSRDGCNTALPIIQDNPLSCVKCDSATDPDCVLLAGGGRTAARCDLISNGQTDGCYVHARNGTVQRGCLSESFALEQEYCSGEGNWCEVCTAAGCNRRPIVAEKCVQCDSELDENCVSALGEELMRVECPLSAISLGCYRYQDAGYNGTYGDIVKRGCLSSLLDEEIHQCESGWSGCKRCHGDHCNAKPHFQTCFNCTTAEDLSCFLSANATQRIECGAYTDECFVHVLDNTVTRGCLAESRAELVAECDDPAKCERCDGSPDCNVKPVGADDYCYTCDSRVTPSCRDAVDETMREQCAFSVNALGCFRAEDNDGHVRRGCLNSVSNATVVADCLAQSDTCKTCSGPYCNAKPQFQRCRVCNSTESAACIRSPGAFASQLCTDYLDECYVHADGDVITRGCVSTAVAPVRAQCDSTSDEFCVTCSSGPSCNNRIVDGEFCYECDSTTGQNCGTGANFTMRKQCPLAVNQRGCYLFNDGGEMVKRGCVADLVADERQLCRRERDTCKTCLGNDCNSKETFQRCRVCNSTVSVNCVRAPHVMPTVVCNRYDDECYTHVGNNTVTRGCLQQHAGNDAEVLADCAALGTETCETCSATGTCNQKLVDGEFCMRCDSRVDPNCRDNPNHTLRVQCPLSPIRRGCYRMEDADGDETRVQRGCIADLPEPEIDECAADGARCKSCLGDDCNAKVEFQRCRTCNSTNSVNCIRSPNSFASVVCRRYLDECYTHVQDDVVIRGCLASGPLGPKVDCYEGKTDLCETCSSGPSCNNRIVDGEFCLTCNSETNPDCVANQNFTMRTQCPLAVTPQGCYLYADGGGLVKRGCVAQLIADEVQTCRRQGDTCKTCIGNDCNQKGTFQTCRACDSTQSVNCIRAPHVFAAVQCRAYDDQCITHVRNNTVTRGCRQSMQQHTEIATDCEQSDNEHCERCENGNACNQRLVDGEFCLTCDSATDPNCRDQLNHTMRTQCPLSPSPRGCFRLQTDDGRVRRGCVADLPTAEVDECRAEGDNCKTCVGNDCNAKVAFQQCRACSSANSVNCIRSPGAFAAVTCRSYADECFVHVSSDNIVTRGCLAEASTAPAVRDECRTGDGEMCETCADRANCNNRLVDGEFCLQCDSASNADCAGGPSLNFTMREQCPLSVRPRGCYLHDNAAAGGNVTRGCVAKLPADERQLCRAEGTECKTCRGNDCNSKVAFQFCRTCSSEQSVSCIRSPGSFASQLCRDYTDVCYTHVVGNVVTRGCRAESTVATVPTHCDIDGAVRNDFCETCAEGRGCNNRLVDGEFCLTCDSTVDPNCGQSANHTMREQCPLAVRPRGCYREENGDGNVVRGCVANMRTEAAVAQCRLQGDSCKTCLGNDCNQQADFQRCKQCTSVTDVDCFRGPKWVDSMTCRNYNDQCYFHVHNNTAQRGCLSNIIDDVDDSVRVDCDPTTGDAERCDLCTGPDCNDRLLDGEFCLECDSETDPKCAQGADWTMRKQCDLSVQRRGCYRYADGGGIVKRGCVADIRPEEVALCRRQGQQCKTCVGDDCNAKETFQTCRVCNSTESVACIRSPGAFASQVCRSYTDVCYAHVVDDVVTRGCLAAAPVEVQRTCETHPELCEQCTGASCNNKLVDGEFCMECDSRIDANCHDSLNHTMRVQCPLAVNQRGCYRAEDSLGNVQRGCVASLSAAAADECAGDPTKCKVCVGNDCNAKAHFQRCKVCNSTENVDCIRGAASWVDTVLCELYTDECFVHVKDDVIVRGCMAEHRDLAHECENADLCEKCTGGQSRDACNAKIVDGEFCLTCDSRTDTNCRLQMSVSLRTQCSLAVSPLGCYHFANESNTNVQRGCISDLSADAKETCRADDVNCKICLGNDCNKRPEFPRCLTCDSTRDAQCAAPNTESTRTLDCADYTDDCYTLLNGTQVLRGCVRAAPVDIPALCDGNDSNCRICAGGQCNQINVEPESCYECDSRTQGVDCVLDMVHTKRCSNAIGYSFDRRGCFHHVMANGSASDGVRRGCVAHLERAEQTHCSEQTDCKTCQGDDCNKLPEFQRCFKCGFFDDGNCADNTTASMLSSDCNLYENSCATYILTNGDTVRGCQRDLRFLAEVSRLECVGQDCNGVVYPADRLQCHQCTGADCSDAQAPTKATACHTYRADDECYGYLDEKNHMNRGCVSDVVEQRDGCTEAGEACERCTTDGCNGAASYREPTIACVQCGESDDCAWAQLEMDASLCRKPVAYGRTETCYTFQTALDGAQRGCTNDLVHQNGSAAVVNACPPGASCQFCGESGCNTHNTVMQVCQVCNSSLSDQRLCANADLSGFAVECPPSTYADRGCYTRNDDDVITRGCSVTLEQDKLAECRDPEHKNKCALCLVPNCNTEEPPSAAFSLRAMSMLTLLSAALLVAVLTQNMY